MTPELIQAIGGEFGVGLAAWQAMTSKKVRDLETRLQAVESSATSSAQSSGRRPTYPRVDELGDVPHARRYSATATLGIARRGLTGLEPLMCILRNT